MTGYDDTSAAPMPGEASVPRDRAISMSLRDETRLATVSPTTPVEIAASFGSHIITGSADDFGQHQDEIDRLATMNENEREEWLGTVPLSQAGPLLSRVNSVTDEHRARANRSEGLGDWIRGRFADASNYGQPVSGTIQRFRDTL